MGTNQMGQWSNPPLAYVVAELNISPYYEIAHFVPRIQGALREKFPRTIEGAEISFENNTSGARPSPNSDRIWHLLTADSTRGVHLSTRSISLHATSYEDFSEFSEWLKALLRAIEASQLSPFVEKAGLRYLDYILPSGDKRPADYIAPELRGISPPGAGPAQTAMWVGKFPLAECTVNSRVAAPAFPGSVLPPNFYALPLAKPNTMIDVEKRIEEKSAFGFIDTDCARAVNTLFDATALLEMLDRMHDHVSATFKAVMSELAEKEWE